MTRITSSAANTILISRFLQTQRTLHDLQTQVGTEKRAQTYSGLALSSQRLVNIENTKSNLERFNSNNTQAQLRLDIQTTAVSGIKDAVRDFRELLFQFSNADATDSEAVEQIQDDAYRSLLNIQNLLNTEADGRYIFGGGKVNEEPVNFGITSVTDFQSTFDGARVSIPTTRDAHLENFSISRNSSTLNPAWLTFEQADAGTDKSRINSSVAQFSNIEVGTTIRISDTVGGVNDGVFTVDSVDPNGMWIDVRTEQLTDETTPVFATFTYPNPDDPRTTSTTNTVVVFDRRTSTITASTAGELDDIPEGTKITISGTVDNDGTYTVDSNDGTDLVVKSKRLISDGGAGSTAHTVGAGNTLTFSNATGANGEDQLIASTAGTYSSLEDGQKIKINNTNTENDGKIFTVKSVSADGTTLTLASDENVDVSTATVTTGIVSLRTEMFSFNAAERNFYFDASVVGGDQVQFTDNGANADTITLTGATFTDADGDLLPAGMQVTFTGTGANNATYTIASISADGATATLVATDTVTTETAANAVADGAGSITFADNDPSADSITLGGGFFRDAEGNNLPAGTIFSLAGTGTANDGTSFTIASVSTDGRTATLIPTDTIDDTTPTVTAGTMNAVNTLGTISAESYYNGDNISLTHRASDTRNFEFNTNAIDPAFEKAIRGMMLILQGEFGSEGGLDQNQNRIGEALFLMDDALDRTNSTPPPFGEELGSNIEELEIELGFRAVLLNDIETSNDQIIAYLESSISEVENINELDTIARLLDSQRVLEASFQTFSRVRQLSLTSFL